MKYRRTFTVKFLLFLFAVIFLAGCEKNDAQERARVKHVANMSAQLSKLKIWSHGPRNTYVTMTSNDPSLTEEGARRVLDLTLTRTVFVQMIELGFTKFYFGGPGYKIELYPDRKEKCWKFK